MDLRNVLEKVNGMYFIVSFFLAFKIIITYENNTVVSSG